MKLVSRQANFKKDQWISMKSHVINVTVHQLFADGLFSMFREGNLELGNCLELFSFMVYSHKNTPMSICSFTNEEVWIKYHRMTLWTDFLTTITQPRNESVANLYRFQPLDKGPSKVFNKFTMNVAAHVTLFPTIADPFVRRSVASLAASKSFP
jgi:hypothetical protein